MDHSVYRLSQWDAMLKCNVSQWLSPYPEWSLCRRCICCWTIRMWNDIWIFIINFDWEALIIRSGISRVPCIYRHIRLFPNIYLHYPSQLLPTKYEIWKFCCRHIKCCKPNPFSWEHKVHSTLFILFYPFTNFECELSTERYYHINRIWRFVFGIYLCRLEAVSKSVSRMVTFLNQLSRNALYHALNKQSTFNRNHINSLVILQQ